MAGLATNLSNTCETNVYSPHLAAMQSILDRLEGGEMR